jgi:hypothetical protein
MINPHFCYILGFAFSLLVYQLGWSEAYPPLRFSLAAFLVITILIHFFLARNWSKDVLKRTDLVLIEPKINPWIVTGILYICWSADFFREGGIPLFKVFLNHPYDYKVFGVPMLHVFNVTFASFYSIYLFHLFLLSRKKKFLILYSINMFAAILIYSRSMLFFNLASTFFLYLLHLEKLPYKKLLLAIPLVIVLFYFFGIVGTKRVSFEHQRPYDPTIFLEIGKATPQFRESFLSKEFFWPYIYISSPLANLQTNINTYSVKPITLARILEFINNEILFESISKRINKMADIERENENTIKDPFNVSTVYSRGYSYLGWWGIFLIGIVVVELPFLYKNLVINNPYQFVSYSILCTSYLFLCYDNTIRLMALGFQLVYPVVFPYVEKAIGHER